MGMQAFFLLKG